MNPSDWASQSNATLLDMVIGAVMPLAVSVVLRSHWPNWFRALVTAFCCITAALLKCWTLGQLTQADILKSILLVMLTCFTFYRNFWKPVGAAPAIEAATSPKPAPTTDTTKDENE